MSDSFFEHGQKPESKPLPEELPGPENQGSDTPTSDDRRMAALMAYIPFLCFVPLLRMRNDPYVYFHARQGLVLFFVEIVAFIFSFPHLSQLFWSAIIIGCIGAAVAGVMFAMQGKMHKIPIIGDIADRLRI